MSDETWKPPWSTLRRCTVFSPHFDDGILSLGGLLASAGRRATVVTVFGGIPAPELAASTWDAQAGFVDGAEAAVTRRQEDLAACRLLDIDHVHLPYLDAPYRTSPSDLAALDEMLRDLVTETTVVFAPAGIGDHVDHVTVRELVLQAARSVPSAEVRLYADLPYAATSKDWTTCGPDEWLAEARWQRKRDALFAYASQLAPLGAIFGNIMASDGPLRRELTWRVEPERQS
jgi:LmbE family N-acetylglucosaminyl deacetylase